MGWLRSGRSFCVLPDSLHPHGTGYKDNFPLGIFMDSFPIRAEALGDAPCTTSELDELVQETLL